ncbi:MAG: zf-HC2 domain-containing protein [Candidatus Zixiibacteriota bacterium]|nr:MAG: zf-HC2 domain-containing protein [candidate division Zixibacteria bacterium]
MDHGLPVDEQRMIEEHLQACDECRDLLARLKKLDALVETHSGLGETEYWEQLASRIDRRLQAAGEEKIVPVEAGRSVFTWKLIATAASIVLVAVIGWRWEQIFGPEQVTQTTPADTVTKPAEQHRREEATVPRKTIQEHFEITTETGKEKTAVRRRPTQQPLERKITVTPKQAVDTLMKSRSTAPSMAPSALNAPPPVKKRPKTGDFNTSMEGYAATSIDTTGMLNHWRQVRDQLLPMLAENGSGRARRRAIAAAKEKDTVVGLTDTALLKLDRSAKEKLLLESLYHIAEQSPDTLEVNNALALLKKTAKDKQSPERELARSLLKRLGVPVAE